MERKVWVGAAKDGDEMSLESPNGAFSGVPSVDMGWHELVVDVVVVKVGPEGSRSFVVKALECWLETTFDQELVYGLVRSHD